MRRNQITSALWAQGRPLSLILDTARCGKVGHRKETALASKLEQTSLYEGADATELRDVEPVLLALGTHADAHERLTDAAWGRAWGVWLTSSKPFAEVAAHLRSLIKVRTEDGQIMYFRYYDPRVLRVFLPTCTPEERREFFGPIQSFLMESEDGSECLVFDRDGPAEPRKLA